MLFPILNQNIPQNLLYPISTHTMRMEDVLKVQEKAALAEKFFISRSPGYFLFKDKVTELKNLKDNWDGYGGFAPDYSITRRVEKFIKKLPQNYQDALSEDGVFPNPHGTITVEWRKNSNVVSIEFGQTKSGFYSILRGNKEAESNLDNILSSKKLINALNSIIA